MDSKLLVFSALLLAPKIESIDGLPKVTKRPIQTNKIHHHVASYLENMPKNPATVSFEQFLEMFPLIEFPVTLGEDTHLTFSRENEPLQATLIEQWIVPLEGTLDEFSEVVAGFRVPDTHDFHAVLYWKAGLMSYQYVLVTFEKNGTPIDRRVVAGLHTDANTMTRSVATFDEDWMIYVVTGQVRTEQQEDYDPTKSKAFELELLPNGKIVEANG